MSDPEGSRRFEAVFRDEYPSIVRLAYLMLGDRSAAEDVAQEAFARMYARWPRISGYERPGAWVRLVAIRLAGEVRRRREVPAELDPSVPALDRSPDAELGTALLALPRMQQAVVILHCLEDRPLGEVADILGIATPTARVHLHRARKHLRQFLTEVSDVDG